MTHENIPMILNRHSWPIFRTHGFNFQLWKTSEDFCFFCEIPQPRHHFKEIQDPVKLLLPPIGSKIQQHNQQVRSHESWRQQAGHSTNILCKIRLFSDPPSQWHDSYSCIGAFFWSDGNTKSRCLNSWLTEHLPKTTASPWITGTLWES